MSNSKFTKLKTIIIIILVSVFLAFGSRSDLVWILRLLDISIETETEVKGGNLYDFESTQSP